MASNDTYGSTQRNHAIWSDVEHSWPAALDGAKDGFGQVRKTQKLHNRIVSRRDRDEPPHQPPAEQSRRRKNRCRTKNRERHIRFQKSCAGLFEQFPSAADLTRSKTRGGIIFRDQALPCGSCSVDQRAGKQDEFSGPYPPGLLKDPLRFGQIGQRPLFVRQRGNVDAGQLRIRFGRTTAKARDLGKLVFVGWSGPAETLQQAARPSITSSSDQRYPGHIRDLENEDRTTHEPHCGGAFGLLRGRLNRSAGRLRSGKEVMDGQPEVFALFIKPSRSLGNTKLAEKLRPIFVIPCFGNLAVLY